jgi:hypothetical protein
MLSLSLASTHALLFQFVWSKQSLDVTVKASRSNQVECERSDRESTCIVLYVYRVPGYVEERGGFSFVASGERTCRRTLHARARSLDDGGERQSPAIAVTVTLSLTAASAA